MYINLIGCQQTCMNIYWFPWISFYCDAWISIDLHANPGRSRGEGVLIRSEWGVTNLSYSNDAEGFTKPESELSLERSCWPLCMRFTISFVVVFVFVCCLPFPLVPLRCAYCVIESRSRGTQDLKSAFTTMSADRQSHTVRNMLWSSCIEGGPCPQPVGGYVVIMCSDKHVQTQTNYTCFYWPPVIPPTFCKPSASLVQARYAQGTHTKA